MTPKEKQMVIDRIKDMFMPNVEKHRFVSRVNGVDNETTVQGENTFYKACDVQRIINKANCFINELSAPAKSHHKKAEAKKK
jgi:hypothetical protein